MMERKPLPIGIEDFKEVIDSGYYFVDKTLMIKDLIVNKVKVGLFTRPRRFGKTLNMSMIQRFFEKTDESNAYLFDRLKISEYPECMQYQGQSPVISISLKSMKQGSYKDAFHMFKVLIAREYDRHKDILKNGKISDSERDLFHSILNQRAEDAFYLDSIKFLSDIMVKYYNKNVIILIDEYDVPLENAFHQGFYTDMVNLIRSVFESALKTNPSLDHAFLTGCLRVSKESIFTGLNNLQIFSIMSTKFDDSFGFTQEEINVMLECYDLTDKSSDIAHWYDGYKFNDVDIYNPWSVLNYLSEAVEKSSALCKPYWSNTSSNEIVKRLIEESNDRTKNAIEELINGTPVRAQIYEDITYGTIDVNSEYIWSFLLFTGYLKVTAYETIGDETYYEMVIPNTEVKSIYKNTIRAWFEKKINADSRTDIIESIIYGEPEKLEKQLRHWLLTTISYHDEQESYYHGFVTGLVSGFADYEVLSNIESGEGRFDLVVKQRSDAEYAAILEFKIAKTYKEMSAKCDEALRQIEEKNYIAGLQDELYRNVSKYGICFCKKRCQVKFGGVDRFEY